MSDDNDANSVGVFAFKETLLDGQTVHFNVLRMKQSFLMWIGTEAKMDNLSVAMMNNHSAGNDVVSSQLLGPSSDIASVGMAKRLAKRTGCQCFISINTSDINIIPEIESIILTKLQTNPNLFYFQ